jgi:hypothetical protein
MAAMRLLLLIAGLLWAAFSPAIAAQPSAPFAPHPDAPDHVVTLVEHVRNVEITHTVVHHGKWTRVETREGAQLTTGYFTPGGPIAVQVYRPRGGGEIAAVSFARGSEYGARPDIDTEPRNTGERQTLLGETCTVWSVVRRRPANPDDPDAGQLSCVTDDGIELWSKFVSKFGVMAHREATRLERRPVAAEEVRPPSELLALSWWTPAESAPAAPPPTPDYETVMTSGFPALVSCEAWTGCSVRTTRHHHPWHFVDEVSATGARRLAVTSTGLHLVFTERQPGDSRQVLGISRSGGETTGPDSKMNRSERILGESCDWFLISMSGAGGNSHCRTQDGIVLMEQTRAGLFRQTMTATHLSRRPVTLDEVTPPVNLLDPKFWGLD